MAETNSAAANARETSLLSFDDSGRPILQRSRSRAKPGRRGFQRKLSTHSVQSPDRDASDSALASSSTESIENNSQRSGDISEQTSGHLSSDSNRKSPSHAGGNQEFDVEEYARKRGLRKIISVILEDESAETEAGKIPEKLLNAENITKVKEASRKHINVLDKLQRHFNVMKEKLYRARCHGMDQGIEAVQRGESPFLEQHMSRINASYQEELEKAQTLRKSRLDSIELEYQTAIQMAWESLETEIDRKMRSRKEKLLERMITEESDFVQGQLREIFNYRKERTSSPSKSSSIEKHGTEVSADDSFGDIWNMMRGAICQKYLRKYAPLEPHHESEEAERKCRKRFLTTALSQGLEKEAVGQPKMERSQPKTKKRKNGTEVVYTSLLKKPVGLTAGQRQDDLLMIESMVKSIAEPIESGSKLTTESIVVTETVAVVS